MPRPKHLTWEESACYTLTLATAYRMLFGWRPNVLRPGQNVLVWGASGGLGVFARAALRRLRRARDRRRLRRRQEGLRAVDGRESRAQSQGLQLLGPAAESERPEFGDYMKECRKFGKAIWEHTGGKDVDIVFEHPGEATFPVSVLVCKRGGMVVICAGTTGYNLTMDARFLWMRQKRVQGSATSPTSITRARPTSSSSTAASTRPCRKSSPGSKSPTRTRRCSITSTRPETWPCW